MDTYNTNQMDTLVVGRSTGAFAKIRETVLKLIPEGRGTTVGQVVKELQKTAEYKDKPYRTLYNYARNACQAYMEKHNGRVFIVHKKLVESKGPEKGEKEKPK